MKFNTCFWEIHFKNKPLIYFSDSGLPELQNIPAFASFLPKRFFVSPPNGLSVHPMIPRAKHQETVGRRGFVYSDSHVRQILNRAKKCEKEVDYQPSCQAHKKDDVFFESTRNFGEHFHHPRDSNYSPSTSAAELNTSEFRRPNRFEQQAPRCNCPHGLESDPADKIPIPSTDIFFLKNKGATKTLKCWFEDQLLGSFVRLFHPVLVKNTPKLGQNYGSCVAGTLENVCEFFS